MENITQTQSVTLNKHIETEGFDLQAGKTWIYPTNYPTRDYQYNIIQKALLKNTLVSLPTGLGKTFIAAVIMYNIYRWYPHGKVIFMAPTKPLVKQQVDACYNIMAIPPEVTAELTGAKISASRTNIWTEKRVFFVTPQVLQNDLNKISELGSKIKCLVFDEAHRAKGNHAYCEVIRSLLAQNHKYFRVLALSATPGSTVNDVLEVIQNLLISHVEFRTEESLDVAPYVFRRSLETVVVQLGEKLEEIRDEYLKIVEQYVKTLIKFNVVHGNCGALTKGKIFMIMKDFQNRNRGTNSSNYSEIMRCLNICVTLYHALELLIRHGLRNFLSFYDEHIEKPLLRGNTQLRLILNNVREYLGPIPNIEVLPDGTYPEIPKNIVFGHPKYYKLRDVLVSHFTQAETNSRVIVFFEYRESVMEAHTMLLQARPLIQPKIFLGQGSGITQKVQLGVVKAFREGKCNTLLSTCIGEEGLDVGEVDLIVCFDISNRSPIRMVQRMGRTGRKREGRIVVLVTEGREQQTLKDCLIHKSNISTFVLESKQLNTGMYPDSPRLMPENLTPQCEKMFITVKKIVKKNSVKDMLRSLSSNSSELVFSQEVNILNIKERIPKTTMLFSQDLPINKGENVKENPIFYKFIEKQRTAQKIHKVKHSKYTNILTDLLCSADSKRFNIPTQVQNLTQGNASKSLKQGDIRDMFKKGSQLDFQPTQKSIEEGVLTPMIEKTVEDSIDNSDDLTIPKEAFTLISNYLFTQMTSPLTECRHCPPGFHCRDFSIYSTPSLVTNNNWVPSEDILDTISLTDLENFTRSLDPLYQSTIHLDEAELFQIMDDVDSHILNNVDFTQLEKEAGISNRSIIAEAEKSFNFEAPQNFSNLLDKFGTSIFMSQENIQTPEESDTNRKQSELTEKSLLEFCMLDSLSDLFTNASLDSSQNTVIYSQNLSGLDTNENNLCNIVSRSPSPIISLDERRKQRIRSRIAQTERLTESSHIKQTGTCPDLATELQLTNKDSRVDNEVNNIDINDFCDLSSFGISEVKRSEDINDVCDLSSFGESEVKRSEDINDICGLSSFGISEVKRSEDINDVCDLSSFGLSEVKRSEDISDICDLSSFGISDIKRSEDINDVCDLSSVGISDIKHSESNANKSNMTDIEQICDLSDFGIITRNNTVPAKDTNISENHIIGNDYRNINKNNDDSYTNNLSQNSNKENYNTNLNSSDSKYKSTSNPRKKDYNKSPRVDVGQTFDKMDFNLPTQRSDFTKKSDFNYSKPNFTQKSNCICEYGDNEVFGRSTQPNNLNKTGGIDEFEDSEVFEMPTQPNNLNKTGGIDEFEDSEVFEMPTQTINSKEINTCTKRSESENKNNFDSSVVEKVECIDLTVLNQTSAKEKSLVTCESQIPITQMLSLLNKTQRESLKGGGKVHSVPLAQKSSMWNKSKNTWLSKLSTKKNARTRDSLTKIQSQSAPRKEADPYLFPINFKSNKEKPTEKGSTSSDEFEDSVFLKPDLSSVKPGRKFLENRKAPSKRCKKKTNNFLDLEAALSADENVVISEDEDEENNDFYEKSFVDDDTQNFDTQMHAKYLQSVRSPANPRRFKIPIRPAVNISNVYSQPPSTELDTYMEDSFCVDADETELTQRNELSQLEILEKKLKEKKKRKISDEKDLSKPKRRRVICFDSDDSD